MHYSPFYCSRNRQVGKTALWNPGCDHAGIATQVRLLRNTEVVTETSAQSLFLFRGFVVVDQTMGIVNFCTNKLCNTAILKTLLLLWGLDIKRYINLILLSECAF